MKTVDGWRRKAKSWLWELDQIEDEELTTFERQLRDELRELLSVED